jgi:hypothetical protein
MANNQYRCYFIDQNDRIKGVEQIDCKDDAEAALKAEQLLTPSIYQTAELWQGARLVGRWGNGGEVTPRSEQGGPASERAGVSGDPSAWQSAK